MPGTLSSGSNRAGVPPVVRDPQQVVFGQNVLLCGALCSGWVCKWFFFRDPQWWWVTHTSGVRDSCSRLPLPTADNARSTPSHINHARGAVPAAPSCRILGRDSDQASLSCPEHLAVAAAGWVCSQGDESSKEWCLVTVPSFLSAHEVTGASGGA